MEGPFFFKRGLLKTLLVEKINVLEGNPLGNNMGGNTRVMTTKGVRDGGTIIGGEGGLK